MRRNSYHGRENQAREPFSNDLIQKAKKLIEEGRSKRGAATILGICESTLRRRMKNIPGAEPINRCETFTWYQENEIYNYCKANEKMFYGLTLATVQKLIYEYAEINNIDHNFNKTREKASKFWTSDFLRRRPDIKVRSKGVAKAAGFSKPQVQQFYANLKEHLEMYQFPPGRIYNMDETSIRIVPKSIATDQQRMQIGYNIKKTVTVMCCFSAGGHYVPPAFVFPRKLAEGNVMRGAPAGSISMPVDIGLLNPENYLKWLHHFKHHVSPTVESPVILIVDNHISHLSLQASIFCKNNGIFIIAIPYHCSYKLQPLDRAFYYFLKNQYEEECTKWMDRHGGLNVSECEVTSVFAKAFRKVANKSNAQRAFRVTGIYPFNDNIFSEYQFNRDITPARKTNQYPSARSAVSMELHHTVMRQFLMTATVNSQGFAM